MFLCSQFTIIILIECLFTEVMLCMGSMDYYFVSQDFLSVSQLIHPLSPQINERKEGRKVSKKERQKVLHLYRGRISFLSMKTQLMRAYLGKIIGLLNNAA